MNKEREDGLDSGAAQGDNAPAEEAVESYEVDEEPVPERETEPVASESSEPAPTDEPAPKRKKPTAGDRIERWRSGAVGSGAALSRSGALGWKFYVIMSVGALLAAVVLALTNTTFAEGANFWQKLGPGSAETLRVLLRAPIHLCVGMLAFALTAWAAGVRGGRGDLAAARIGLGVSLAIMALQLQWGFPGARMVVYLLAFVLYFLTVAVSFRCAPRVAGMLIVLHVGLFAGIAGLGWLIVWVGL